MRLRLVTLWMLLIPIVVGCQAAVVAPGEQVGRTFSKQVVKTIGYDYLLYLPPDYGKQKDQRWPLMLFLHGAGERGKDLNLVKFHGPPKLVAAGRRFPFILVSPQCPDEELWDTQILNALLDDIIARYAVDADRVYLTGLSMGGYGTWDLATRYPRRFAAIAPICGSGIPWIARTRLAKMPTWVFHGARDGVVPFVFSEKIVEALKKVNAPVKFTVYPETGHDAWVAAYNNPDLYDWFLAQKRPATTAPAR